MAREQLSGIQIPTLSKLNLDGELTLDAASGTSNQFLISNGAGNTPSWSSILTSSGTTIVPLTLRGVASQSGNLTEWQNNTPSTVALVTSGGSIFSSANGGFGSTSALSTARLSVSAAASSIGVIVRGNATTPGNLQEWQTSTPTTVASISSTGVLSIDRIDAPSSSSTTADVFGNITSGTAGFADGLQNGTLNIGNGTVSAGTRTVNINTNGSGTMTVVTNIGSPTLGGTINLAAGNPGVIFTSTGLITTSAATSNNSAAMTLRTGNTTTSGNSGSLTLDVGTAATTAGTISIGTGAASAIAIGRTGLTTTTAGAFTATQTITGGNLTTGGTLTRTALNDGLTTSTATINTAGQFIRTTSSARYKQDIVLADFNYEDILLLQPKTYRLKFDMETFGHARTHAGFIAEDLDQIESLKVFVNYQKQEDDSIIPDGINYAEMVSALVSAIKHQDTLIKSLKTRIEALENN